MKRKYHWLKFGLLASLLGITVGLGLYAFLSFFPTGYGDIVKEKETVLGHANALLIPSEDPEASPNTDLINNKITSSEIVHLPDSTRIHSNDQDCTAHIEHLNEEAAFEWIDGLGRIFRVDFLLPESMFGLNKASGPMVVPPEVMRRIETTVAPWVAEAMQRRYENLKKSWPERDSSVPALNHALDMVEQFLLEKDYAYPEFSKFPREKDLTPSGYEALAVLTIARAGLRGEHDKATRLLARYLEHERIHHIGQFPPYRMGSAPFSRASSALMILGESGVLSAKELDAAQKTITEYVLSPMQLAELRKAHAIRLSEDWAQRLPGLQAVPEKTWWRKVSRQYPAAIICALSRPIIRNQVRNYSVAFSSGDEASRFHALKRFSLISNFTYMKAYEHDLIQYPFPSEDFLSQKPNCTDADFNAGANMVQLALATVRHYIAQGCYPGRIEALTPWLSLPLRSDSRSAWAVGIMPPQDVLAYYGNWSEDKPPDDIDRIIWRYRDEQRQWPATAEELKRYWGNTTPIEEARKRQTHLEATPLLCYFQRATRRYDRPFYKSREDAFACATPEEREAFNRRFDQGVTDVELIEITIEFPIQPLFSERLKAMLK